LAKKKTTKKTVKKKAKKKVSATKVKKQKKKVKVSDPAKEFALAAAKVATGRHCSEIVVLDLCGKSPATDYFVIATGTSDRQMRTVADEICETAKELSFKRFGRAGYEQARWILLDFVDVVIHIFDGEYRNYYDLELLWGDAERLTIDEG
jgi:ribosome-associated protein